MNAGTLSWQAISEAAGRQQPFVLVTVFSVKGSSPREEGAKMLVSAEGVQGTIGGGNMEFQAIQTANEWLATSQASAFKVVEAPLTPKFDQCCGGQVTLVYEKVLPSAQHWTSELGRLLTEKDKICQAGVSASTESIGLMTQRTASGVTRYWVSPALFRELALSESLFEPLHSPSTLNIVLFGAGHVGKALVQNLAHLDVEVTWVDSREQMFPSAQSPKVKCLQTNDWQTVVKQAPAGSYFLVMTHSHQLDYALTEAILEKANFKYFGLIGSAKKRQRFERQLLKNTNFAPAMLGKMTCPIGLPSIQGKSPEVIAASVTAQLLAIHSEKNSQNNLISEEVRYV